MTQLLFTRRSNLASGFIRAVCWSEWSHVQLVVNGKLVGASFPNGVCYEDLQHRLDISSKAVLVDIPVPNEQELISFVESQIGKPYDFIGAVGLSIHRDWQDNSAWWCSEFVAKALLEGGQQLFRDDALNRITPQHLFILNYPIKVLK